MNSLSCSFSSYFFYSLIVFSIIRILKIPFQWLSTSIIFIYSLHLSDNTIEIIWIHSCCDLWSTCFEILSSLITDCVQKIFRTNAIRKKAKIIQRNGSRMLQWNNWKKQAQKSRDTWLEDIEKKRVRDKNKKKCCFEALSSLTSVWTL